MKNMTSRVLSVLLSMAMVLSLVSVAGIGVFAESGEGSTYPAVSKDAEGPFPELPLDTEVSVSFGDNECVKFDFTPDETCGYLFFSYDYSKGDPYVEVYAEDYRVDYDDDDDNSRNFELSVKLVKDTTYTVIARGYDNEAATYKMKAQKLPDASEIVATPNPISVYPGYFFPIDYNFGPDPCFTEDTFKTPTAKDPTLLYWEDGKFLAGKPGSTTITLSTYGTEFDEESQPTNAMTLEVPVEIKEPIALEEGTTKIEFEQNESYNWDSWSYITYAFTPEETGLYEMYSLAGGRDIDVRVLYELTDPSDYDLINDDCYYTPSCWENDIPYKTNSGSDFYVAGKLEKDKTYLIVFGGDSYDGDPFDFDVVLQTVEKATTLSFVQGDEVTILENGYLDLQTVENPVGKELTWDYDEEFVSLNDSSDLGIAGFYPEKAGETTIKLIAKDADTEEELVAEIKVTIITPPAIEKDVPVTVSQEIPGQSMSFSAFIFTPAEAGTYTIATTDNVKNYIESGVWYADNTGVAPITYQEYYKTGTLNINYPITVSEDDIDNNASYLISFRAFPEASDSIEDFTVLVTDQKDAESFTLFDGDTFEGCVGDRLYFVPTFSPANSTPETIYFKSDDTDVAYGEDDNVYLAGEGEATITAYIGDEEEPTYATTFTVIVSPQIVAEENTIYEIPGDPLYERSFLFTPTESGTYYITSDGDVDTYVEFGTEGSYIGDNDDGAGDGKNFRAKVNMTAGETYIFFVCLEEYAVDIAYRVVISSDPEARPTETTTATETETTTATEAEPTETEAEKEYHAIDSWNDNAGVNYVWLNPSNGSGQVQVYSYNEGSNGAWSDFAGKWANLAANQAIEITYTGNFAGVTKDKVSFDSRVWNETGRSSENVVSVSEDKIVVRLNGPLTSKLQDPNLGLIFADDALTAISDAEDTHVSVVVYEEGAEPTATEVEPTATEIEPTATEVEPTATEVEPTESKETTEPTAKPTESKESTEPTDEPTVNPTDEPTVAPTVEPTEPVIEPTETPDETDVTATATGTGVADIIYGDANNDGVVNMKDVLTLRKYIAGIEVEIDLATADANADGDINMKDVLSVRKFIAGILTVLGA